MYTNIEAQVALAKCKEGKKIYGVRMEKKALGWEYNWAFVISEKRAKAEKYDSTVIKGQIYPSKEYPGCPYCGTKTFVICGNCKRLYCYDKSERISTCEWCGNVGELADYTGSGISSSEDI